MDSMVLRFVLKTLLSALIIAGASELSRRSQLFGALLISLPLTSILALIWLWADTRDAAKVAALSTSILWLVLPSLVLFAALPLLLRGGLGFPAALAVACVATAAAYGLMVVVLRQFGIAA
jgi:hypothetical protein